MRYLTALFSLVLLATPGAANADDLAADIGEVYEKPEYPPEYSLGVGFRQIDAKGSGRASEYTFLESFPTFSAELLALPGWHRVHVHANLQNTHDYFFDGSYAYRDLVTVRWVSSTSYHNLDATRLVDLGNDTRYGVFGSTAGEPLGLTTGLHRVELRLKMPNFPAHLFASARLAMQGGDREQRFLGGSGSFDRLQRGTGRRPVDWMGQSFRLGVNAHLGPVEVEGWHREYWRKVGDGAEVAYGFRGSAVRPAGVYRLAALSNGRGRTDTLRAHSSYTGRLVGSLTLSRDTLESELTGAASTTLLGAASLKWMPWTKLVFALRAHVRDLALDNPETVSAGRVGDASGGESFALRPSLSTTTTRLAAEARYRVIKNVTLRADFVQLAKHRRHARVWNLPLRTVRNRGGGGVQLRAHRTLKLKASYQREHVDAASHNTEMDSSDWLTAEASWTPMPELALQAHYEGELGRRRQISYVVDGARVDVSRGEKRRHRITGFGRLNVSHAVALHAHYAYVGLEDELTLLYDGFTADSNFLLDPMVPYREDVHAGGFGFHLEPMDALQLEANLRLTVSKAGFFPGLDEALAPTSIASFSRLRVRDLTVDVKADYEVYDGWRVALEGAYREHDNLRNLAANPRLDGEVWAGMLHLAREWK